ncbi:NADP-binding protein [Heyndrickxia coagulans]|uniref:NAD dependent epimerase/dehydratase family protein n=1 Tax=Heyndrickxia coagulans DSM 1 = ATCC 7050 TaxID=1121088 RepID=A0A8B4BTU7_HEYCO|nr:NADP-binding protein [Heyndrickxia coagulans]AJH77905.1 hypothetical protein BF29_3346 [Heyndrickxia coagulans DSM 1 = ATCC 7050]MCR2845548.1 NADP-binding protein [Heyndrickxia coagulans]MDR4224488.1 NADP-binding protein [Heyndrickxia coagulans DSM 1 = ATCC 7050]MED4494998.1 NADP-binding protein [Heyndrickxia coagulans]MED4535969.1 NADP-binding protein [Heyndrickxia coagulans]
MNQALVIGAGAFFGFELCKALLDAGYPVIAADQETDPGFLMEERWMEIGRNANLEYQPLSRLSPEKCTCCIPVYDYYVRDACEDLQDACRFLEPIKAQIECVALILPNHLAGAEQTEWVPGMLGDCARVTFFVPALFGPGQPGSLAFSQMINGNPEPDLKYDDRDALFAADAAGAIVSGLEKRETGKVFYLKSPDGNGWEPIARFLTQDTGSRPLPSCRLDARDEWEPMIVRPSVSWQAAIQQQIACQRKNS